MSNWSEMSFQGWAERQGWVALRHGWPDFLCTRADEVMAVEVKWGTGLTVRQEQVLLQLAAIGIPTFLWSPDDERLVAVADLLAGVNADVTPLEAAASWRLRAEAAERSLAALHRDIDRRSAKHTEQREGFRRERQVLLEDVGYLLRRAVDTTAPTMRLAALARRYRDLM